MKIQNSKKYKEGTLNVIFILKNGNIYATGYTYLNISSINFSGNNLTNEIVEFNGGEMKDIVISDNGDIITVGSGEVRVMEKVSK